MPEEYLASINYDPNHPGSYLGNDKLYQTVKVEGKYHIGRRKIARCVRDQDSYSLTKGVMRKFNRSRVLVEGLGSQWDVDLMDMKDEADSNDGYQYVSVAIDFSADSLGVGPYGIKRPFNRKTLWNVY